MNGKGIRLLVDSVYCWVLFTPLSIPVQSVADASDCAECGCGGCRASGMEGQTVYEEQDAWKACEDHWE